MQGLITLYSCTADAKQRHVICVTNFKQKTRSSRKYPELSENCILHSSCTAYAEHLRTLGVVVVVFVVEGGGAVGTVEKDRGPEPKPEQQNPKTSAPASTEKYEDQNQPTARGEISKALREQGCNITPSNPFLVKWVECGVTCKLALEAVQIARDRKPKPEPIPPAYLDPIIADLMSGKQVKSQVSSSPKIDTACRRVLPGGQKCGMPANAHPIHGFSCAHCNRKDEESRAGRVAMPSAIREALGKIGKKEWSSTDTAGINP